MAMIMENSLSVTPAYGKFTGHIARPSSTPASQHLLAQANSTGLSISSDADKSPGPSTSPISDRFTGFITSRGSGVAQSVGEVGGAGGFTG